MERVREVVRLPALDAGFATWRGQTEWGCFVPDPATIEPAKQYLTYIHRRWQDLRGADKLPESVED